MINSYLLFIYRIRTNFVNSSAHRLRQSLVPMRNFILFKQHLIMAKMSTSSEIQDRPTKIRKLESPSDDGISSSPITGTIAEEATVCEHDNQVDSSQNDQGQGIEPKISKNQMKKLKRREKWEANRDFRITKRREKQKEKKSRKAQERAELEAKITSGEMEAPKLGINIKNGKDKRPYRPIQMSIGMILDTSFNDFMTEREIVSLAAQLTRCYSLNKSASYRTHLAVSSWGGILKSRFENVLANTHLSWTGVEFLDEDFISAGRFLHEKMVASDRENLAGNLTVKDEKKYTEAESLTVPCEPITSDRKFESMEKICAQNLPAKSPKDLLQKADELSVSSVAELQHQPTGPGTSVDDIGIPKTTNPSLVYLTSDSPHTLTCLSPYTSYIIGGIVDKNRHKGLCYKRACEQGIPTAKLPIENYMKMQSRTVLAVNHVVEIMLKWLEIKDWGEAFVSVIPKRKGAVLKIGDSKNEQASLGENENYDASDNEE